MYWAIILLFCEETIIAYILHH